MAGEIKQNSLKSALINKLLHLSEEICSTCRADCTVSAKHLIALSSCLLLVSEIVKERKARLFFFSRFDFV